MTNRPDSSGPCGSGDWPGDQIGSDQSVGAARRRRVTGVTMNVLSVVWQVFDAAGRAMDVRGQAPGVPVWSFAAPVTRPDEGFAILY